ncbi:MAG: YdcF family protein [Rubrivivax sp.]
MTDYIVIFGAAVRADGSASGSLQRRCENAARFGLAAAGAGRDVPYFLATGGVGRHGPAEALVMRDILVEHGIPVQHILLEGEARDTLQSVRRCTRLLRRRPDVERVLVASSSYHNPRCTLLFRLAGFRSQPLPTASDRPHLGWPKWLRYVLKELIATPWDATVLLAHKMSRTI